MHQRQIPNAVGCRDEFFLDACVGEAPRLQAQDGAHEPSAHHERGVHARNYGDLPLFDMIFGTFHNPKEFVGEVGFFEGSSRKVGPMLIGKVIA